MLIATVILVPVWKRDISQRGILKSHISHVLNFKSWIKLIYDKITQIYNVKNQFNSNCEVKNIGNIPLKNEPFGKRPISNCISESPVSTSLNFKSWIKLIYDKIT